MKRWLIALLLFSGCPSDIEPETFGAPPVSDICIEQGWCRDEGWCVSVGRVCMAVVNWDCEHSKACYEQNRCKVLSGNCVNKKELR